MTQGNKFLPWPKAPTLSPWVCMGSPSQVEECRQERTLFFWPCDLFRTDPRQALWENHWEYTDTEKAIRWSVRTRFSFKHRRGCLFGCTVHVSFLGTVEISNVLLSPKERMTWRKNKTDRRRNCHAAQPLLSRWLSTWERISSSKPDCQSDCWSDCQSDPIEERNNLLASGHVGTQICCPSKPEAVSVKWTCNHCYTKGLRSPEASLNFIHDLLMLVHFSGR